jgi:hypothetical protein
MKTLFDGHIRKITFLFILSITLLAIILLSSGISRLSLNRGSYLLPERTPTPSVILENPPEEIFQPPDGDFVFPKNLALILFWGVVLFSSYFVLFEKDSFMRRVIGSLFLIAAVIFLMSYLAEADFFDLPSQMTAMPETTPGIIVPMPDVSPISSATSFLIGFSILFGLILVGYLIWQRVKPVPEPQVEIKQQAQVALDDLSRGLDIEDIILRCYYQMSETLKKQKGISRSQSMTPREFEERLGELGFPLEHVADLTRLFEKVRYGDSKASKKEEAIAVRSLKMIIQSGEDL